MSYDTNIILHSNCIVSITVIDVMWMCQEPVGEQTTVNCYGGKLKKIQCVGIISTYTYQLFNMQSIEN